MKSSLSRQGKQLILFVADDKISSFQVKIRCWKTSMCSHKVESLPICKHFSDVIRDDIKQYDFLWCLMKCNTTSKGIPHTSRTSISRGPSIMLQSDAWREDPSKMQDRKIGFNITKNESSLISSHIPLQPFEDTTPFTFWYGTQARKATVTWKTIRVILFLQPHFCVRPECFSCTSAKRTTCHKELDKKKVVIF